MPVFSIKTDGTFAIRAFSTVQAAVDDGYFNTVFTSQKELLESRFTDDDLRHIHKLVTGHQTKLTDRDWLCELIFNALVAADLPCLDTDMQFSVIQSQDDGMAVEIAHPDAVQEVVGNKTGSDDTQEPLSATDDIQAPEPQETAIEVATITQSVFPYKLNETPEIKYSRREKLVFNTIVDSGLFKITTKEISARAYATNEPFHIKTSIVVAIKSLQRKLIRNNEPFRLYTGGNSGPRPMEVWIDPVNDGEVK
jgi:hypothetical protein